MPNYIAYINPNCSKCRIVLSELERLAINAKIRLYLEAPLLRDEAVQIIELFGADAVRDLKEPLDKGQLVDLLVSDSSRLQRPIILDGDSGVICRPPEKLNEFLNREK